MDSINTLVKHVKHYTAIKVDNNCLTFINFIINWIPSTHYTTKDKKGWLELPIYNKVLNPCWIFSHVIPYDSIGAWAWLIFWGGDHQPLGYLHGVTSARDPWDLPTIARQRQFQVVPAAASWTCVIGKPHRMRSLLTWRCAFVFKKTYVQCIYSGYNCIYIYI